MGSYPNMPEPEILPPDTGGYRYAPPPPPQPPPPMPPARRRTPQWSQAPATYLLLGINCAVFLAMLARGLSAWAPAPEQLMGWGADNAGAVLLGGEWWRIVTAMFVHVGFIHLATNMWCLWNLGLLAEPLMGSFGVLAVYILTGAAGNLLSTFVNWLKFHDLGSFPVGAGASGAVFGIAGALIVLLKPGRLPVPLLELKRLRKSVVYFAALNLIIPIAVNYGSAAMHAGLVIDNMAHLGGCACGLLFAVPMVPRIGSPRQLFTNRLRIAVGMTVGLLVLFGFFLAQLPG